MRKAVMVFGAIALLGAAAAWGCALADAADGTGRAASTDGSAPAGAANILSLNVADVFVKPSESVVVTMDVSQLLQAVNGCQAVIGCDPALLTPAGAAEGGDPWDTLIYAAMAGGSVDVSVGVGALGHVGIQADGTVARLTFTPAGPDGQTTIWFRPDVSDVESTIISDMSAEAIYPDKINSPVITIDGTPPADVQIAVDPAGWANTNSVTLTFSASDALSGVDLYELSIEGIDGGAYFAASSPHVQDVSALADGTHIATVRATDKAGNSASAAAEIRIDRTPPEPFTPVADPASWTNASEITITFSTTDALSAVHYQVAVDAGAFSDAASPYALPTAGLTDGEHIVSVNAIDEAGNSRLGQVSVYVDKALPLIDVTSATQNGIELTSGSPNAVQGTVVITVAASDGTAGLAGVPSVSVTPNGGAPEDITPTGIDNGDGTFTYSYEVTAATPDGIAAISATATDNAGNAASAAASFTVNKNRIAGLVELDALNPKISIVRPVTFKASGPGGMLGEWTVNVTFMPGSPVGSYQLDDVPDGITHLSAKSPWNLRCKVAIVPGANGMTIVNFTDGVMLLGGDINGSNTVNIADYAGMKSHWFSIDGEADINGDNEVGLPDYVIMKRNWFRIGDPE